MCVAVLIQDISLTIQSRHVMIPVDIADLQLPGFGLTEIVVLGIVCLESPNEKRGVK